MGKHIGLLWRTHTSYSSGNPNFDLVRRGNLRGSGRIRGRRCGVFWWPWDRVDAWMRMPGGSTRYHFDTIVDAQWLTHTANETSRAGPEHCIPRTDQIPVDDLCGLCISRQTDPWLIFWYCMAHRPPGAPWWPWRIYSNHEAVRPRGQNLVSISPTPIFQTCKDVGLVIKRCRKCGHRTHGIDGKS